MEDKNLTEEEIIDELNKKREYVIDLSLEEIMDRLHKSLYDTEIILDGYNLVTQINEGQGITLAGILKLREAISEAIDWINENVVDDDMIEETDEL